MRKRTSFFALVFLACTAGAGLASRQFVAVSCAPSTLDVVCRDAANLRVRSQLITSNTPRQVLPQSAVVTSGAGTATIYFGRYADCEIQSPTSSGTRLVTRAPKSFLFTQNYGVTLCTFFNGAQALIADRSKVRSSSSTNLQTFFVGVEATASFAQIRIDFQPHVSLAIAATGGTVLLHLPSDSVRALGPGNETAFTLDDHDQIISTETHLASFNTDESTIFNTQLKKMRKGG
jgi:hypothetical protein